jgi:hypothetical protein
VSEQKRENMGSCLCAVVFLYAEGHPYMDAVRIQVFGQIKCLDA